MEVKRTKLLKAIERKILGISLKYQKINNWISERTPVEDVAQRIASLKNIGVANWLDGNLRWKREEFVDH